MAPAPHGLLQIVASHGQVSLVANRYREKDLAYLRIVLVEVCKRDTNELIHSEPAEQSGILLEHADHVIRPAIHPNRLANGVDLREQGIRDALADHGDGAVMFQIVLRDKAAGGDGELRHSLAKLGFGAAQKKSFHKLFAIADVILTAGERVAVGERAGERDRGESLSQR